MPPKKRPESIALVADDGTTHRYGWNPQTLLYDIDHGPAVVETEPEAPVEQPAEPPPPELPEEEKQP